MIMRGIVYWIMAAVLFAATWKYWTQRDLAPEVDFDPDLVN